MASTDGDEDMLVGISVESAVRARRTCDGDASEARRGCVNRANPVVVLFSDSDEERRSRCPKVNQVLRDSS